MNRSLCESNITLSAILRTLRKQLVITIKIFSHEAFFTFQTFIGFNLLSRQFAICQQRVFTGIPAMGTALDPWLTDRLR